MTDEPIDAEVVEDRPTQVVPFRPPTLAVAPTTEAGELVTRLNVIREAMTTAMQDGVDYGRIPGVNKPSLFKPGAEKLSVLFQLDVQIRNEKHWGPGDHLTVSSEATVFHAPTGTRLGYGEGMCSTRESRYARRKGERVCPQCGKPAIIKGRQEYGGGWVCFKKKDGCGAKYRDGDQQIEGQQVGEIENPDLPDVWNTVVKMSEKRARVDAVLAVTGASALFTQDAEDMAPAPPPTPSPAPRSDVPSDWPPKDPQPSEPPLAPLLESQQWAADIANELKARGMNVGDFRRILTDAGVTPPEDLRSLETRIGFLASLSIDQQNRVAQLLIEQSPVKTEAA